MCFLLKVKSTRALIIKPRFVLAVHMDDLGWFITSNQQGQMRVRNPNTVVGRPNVMPGWILYCTTNWITIKLVFQENFPSNTSFEQPAPSKWLLKWQRGVIWVNYIWMLQQQPILGQEHQSPGGKLFYHMHMWGRQITDCNQTLPRSRRIATRWRLWSEYQQLLMVAIQITHTQERGMHILSIHGSYWCLQTIINLVIQSGLW